MRKNITKNERGITLISLIITIIIIVILAAVSINTVYNMGIVGYAVNGTQDYAKETKKEEDIFENISSLIEKTTTNIKSIEYVGKYVDYTPKSGSYDKITNNSIYTANDSNKTNFETENFKWRIFTINDNKLVLIADNVTKKGGNNNGRLYLKGTNGYNNGVIILNDICKTCYSNAELGAMGRSMKLEDIEDVVNKNIFKPQEFYKQIGENKYYLFSGQYRYLENKLYPYIYKFEEFSNIDGNTPKNGLKRSEQLEYYDDNEIKTANSYLELTQTCYETKNLIEINESTFIDGKYYDLIFKTSDNTNFGNFYLATRGHSINENYGSFVYQKVNANGTIATISLFDSNGNVISQNSKIRPMVEIDLNKVNFAQTGDGSADDPYGLTSKQ